MIHKYVHATNVCTYLSTYLPTYLSIYLPTYLPILEPAYDFNVTESPVQKTDHKTALFPFRNSLVSIRLRVLPELFEYTCIDFFQSSRAIRIRERMPIKFENDTSVL